MNLNINNEVIELLVQLVLVFGITVVIAYPAIYDLL